MKRNFEDFKNYIKNKKVAVVGIGVSNIPLIKFLVSLEAKVTGFDSKTKEELGSIVEEFEEIGVTFSLGSNYLDNLTGYDVVFKTPSMRIDSSALIKAKNEGAYITSEIEEFVRYTRGKVFALTGSDGKTTTTSIIAKLLEEEGYTTWVGGNIGTPLFANIEEIEDNHMVVLELSSFQLMTMNLPVDVAVVTNVTPNHLDMHKDMEEYINSKKNIFLYQDSDSVLVLNKDNDITNSFECEAKGSVRKFTSKKYLDDGASLHENNLYLGDVVIGNISEMLIKGVHNAENFLAAFLATKDDVSIDTMRNVLRTFAGVEHRCELVREHNGVLYYNDSIASSPTRTLAGLKAFDDKVVLIAGGYDKHIPFDVLAEEGIAYIKELILLGATKGLIKATFEKVMESRGVSMPIHIADSLEHAVSIAESVAKKGDTVTLSPACASFDMYPNFMVRGKEFKRIVNNLN